jgi:hypothetical protein
MISLIEFGVFGEQKNTPPLLVTVLPTFAPSPVHLPRSSQNKPGIRFVKLSDAYTKQDYVGWALALLQDDSAN